MKCDCEEINGKILSVCEMHAQLATRYNDREPQPTPSKGGVTPARLELLKVILPALITNMTAGDIKSLNVQAAMAQAAVGIVDETLRRLV